MISVTQIDRLAGALASDSKFQNAFLVDRIAAIEEYNTHYVQRFGGKLIELSDEEKQFISSIQAPSIEGFYELLELELDRRATAPAELSFKSVSPVNPSSLSQAETSAA